MKPILKLIGVAVVGGLAYDFYRLNKFSNEVEIIPTKDISIKKVNKGILITAKLLIKNTSSKEIPLTNITGEILSGNSVFATMQSKQGTVLKPNSNENIVIEFQVNTKNLLSSLASAISSKRIYINYVATISPKLIGLIPVNFNSSGAMSYDISEYLTKIYEALNELKNESE